MTADPILASDLIVGDARASVQRILLVPNKGCSANLGAAIGMPLIVSSRALGLAIPVLGAEALWVGLTMAPDVEIVSARRDGQILAMHHMDWPDGTRFVRSETFGGDGQSLRVEIRLREPDADESILQVDTSPWWLFERRFGFLPSQDPAPTTYGGWQLP